MDISDRASQRGVASDRNSEAVDPGRLRFTRPLVPKLSPAGSEEPDSPTPASPNGRGNDWRSSLASVMNMLQGTAETNGAVNLSGEQKGSRATPNRADELVLALAQMRLSLEAEFDRLERIEQTLRADLERTRAELGGARETARKAIQKSMHDSLTGLPNRACFRSRLDRALTLARIRKQTVGIFFIDLDGFRAVNDAHGHLTGDACLRIIATRMAKAVRINDTVSRYGGDEFACLIDDTDHYRLSRLAGALHTAISEPVTIGNLVLSVRCSIGIAMGSSKESSATELLCSADRAMYHARKLGLGFSFHGSSKPS